MTVNEMIERLRALPPDMLVVRLNQNQPPVSWTSMDGWVPQVVEVVPYDSPLVAGWYREPGRHVGIAPIEALEL